jgi:hypothetical protein
MKTQPLATSASLFDPVPVDAPAKAETKSETKVETKADET